MRCDANDDVLRWAWGRVIGDGDDECKNVFNVGMNGSWLGSMAK